MAGGPLHPAEQYAQDVVAGIIVAGRLVRLACERHLDDLAHAQNRGLYFDREAAQFALDFFPLLRHYKGREWKGKPVTLEAWQQFIIWSIYGWKKVGGMRRFRTAHLEVAKGNGKTTLCAGIGLELLVADGEAGAEIYSAATKKDQARIVHADATAMRDASPSLSKRIQKFRDNLSIPADHSKFEPLGADKDTLDGPRPHGLILDELHAWKSRGVLDVLEEGMGKRLQPLAVRATTASDGSEGVYQQEHEYAEQVLEGTVKDDALFAYIATLDKGDDWRDERNWIKPNPNLGVSVKIEELRERAGKAGAQPSYLNSFLRFRMNVVTQGESAAIRPEDWKACVGYSLAGKDAKVLRGEIERALEGESCFIGADLASTEDIAALVKVFPPTEERKLWVVIPHFYIPEDNIESKGREAREPYDVWKREGFITATEGNVIDYATIEAQVLADCERYDVREIAFDPWNATAFANDLQAAGVPISKLAKFAQTIANFAQPTKYLLEVLIPNRTLAHLANPVLTWMAKNLIVWTDPNGAQRPSKRKSLRKKIDGMVALLNALGRANSAPSHDGSAYSADRGVFLV